MYNNNINLTRIKPGLVLALVTARAGYATRYARHKIMTKEQFIDTVIDVAKKHGYPVRINRYNQWQIYFGHKQLHEGHLAKLYPDILKEDVNIRKLIERVAPGRPCTHRPMEEIIAYIKRE
jgi:hypothetical protein